MMAVDREPERETQAEAGDVDPWTGHAVIDRWVLEMARAIVARIDQAPALV